MGKKIARLATTISGKYLQILSETAGELRIHMNRGIDASNLDGRAESHQNSFVLS
jgi:hypothetical protein